jgi:hypothetical protein
MHFAHDEGSRSPHNLPFIFEGTWSRPFNTQLGYLAYLASLIVLFLLVEHGIGSPFRRPAMGKHSHGEKIGVDKGTLSSVSLFGLIACPGGKRGIPVRVVRMYNR